MSLKSSFSTVFCLACTACASVPNTNMNYYLAKTDVGVKTLRTVACDSEGQLLIASSVAVTHRHSADTGSTQKFSTSALAGAFSDASIKVDFYEDGRLKAVNSSSTGQGESIVKSGTSLAVGALGLSVANGCERLAKASDGKPVTFSYEIDLDLTGKTFQRLNPDSYTAEFTGGELGERMGSTCALVHGAKAMDPPVSTSKEPAKSGGHIVLRQPAITFLSVHLLPSCDTKVLDRHFNCEPGDCIWKGPVFVAQDGIKFSIPMPKAGAFGATEFGVALRESGAIESIKYGRSTGAGQALNAVDRVRDALQDSTAEKLAAVKAEADLIAQQQRLIECRIDPANC